MRRDVAFNIMTTTYEIEGNLRHTYFIFSILGLFVFILGNT